MTKAISYDRWVRATQFDDSSVDDMITGINEYLLGLSQRLEPETLFLEVLLSPYRIPRKIREQIKSAYLDQGWPSVSIRYQAGGTYIKFDRLDILDTKEIIDKHK